MTQTSFSQVVSGFIAAAKKAVADKWALINMGDLLAFFRGLTAEVTVTMKEFSDAVADMINNPLCGDDERQLLQAAIVSRPGALHPSALETYLKATKDEEVAKICLEAFFAHEADFDSEIGFDTPIAWDLKRALAVTTVLAPDQVPAFAEVALEMFPNLPLGANGTGGLRGLLIYQAEKLNPPVATTTNGSNLVTKTNGGAVQPISRQGEANGRGRQAKGNGKRPKSNLPNVPTGKFYDPSGANATLESIAAGEKAIEADRADQLKTLETAKAPAPAFAALKDLKSSLPSMDGVDDATPEPEVVLGTPEDLAKALIMSAVVEYQPAEPELALVTTTLQ